MSEKLKRCAIYIRVSTTEQQMHGKSLSAQEEYLLRYAEEHNMIICGVYSDEGKTARKELKKRKAIHSLLESVKRDEIDIILFWKLDRWFRNLSDFYKVQDILDEHDVSWMSVSEPGINMETRDGRLQLNVVLSIGQNEVDTTSERIKFVNEASIRQKKLIFGEKNMGFGYAIGTIDGKKCMVKDTETEHMANDFFQYFRKHQSKSATVKYMHEAYGVDFSYSMLKTMLSSEFYKGTYRGFPYCPAYLTEQEWFEIQEISNRNVKRARSNRVYLFSSLMHCPTCGQKLVGTGCSSIINRKTGEKRNYCYYRCNRALIDKICVYRHKVSQNLIEDYLLNNLKSEYEMYLIRIKKMESKKDKIRKTKSPKKISDELERLNILYQKGRISWEYYTSEYDRLESEIKEISKTNDLQPRDLTYMDEILETDFKSIYAELSLENRRSFWRSTIKEIVLKSDSTVDHVDFL